MIRHTWNKKNWSVVRHTIGYDRLESSEELALMRSIYDDLRLYINFYQPVLKLVGKRRVDDKTIRTYDKALTPYRRVLAFNILPIEVKSRLAAQYSGVNPIALNARIDTKVVSSQ